MDLVFSCGSRACGVGARGGVDEFHHFGAGCSLAESITGEALAERKEELRKAYPDLKATTMRRATTVRRATTATKVLAGRRANVAKRVAWADVAVGLLIRLGTL